MYKIFNIDTRYADFKKVRGIAIYKKELFDDIDSLTFKYAEASSIPSPKVENAVSSDSSENLDGHILARHIEFRDAKLRSLITFALCDDQLIDKADDKLNYDGCIIYKLAVDIEFKDALLQSLASFIHRYLVWGALYDWYGAGMGNQQANVYAGELRSLEDEIVNTLRARSVAKRPMQPFGPAKRFIF